MSDEAAAGQPVYYYKYILRLHYANRQSDQDTFVFEYSTQKRTITDFHQARLLHILDTIGRRNIRSLELNAYGSVPEDEDTDRRQSRARARRISRWMKRACPGAAIIKEPIDK